MCSSEFQVKKKKEKNQIPGFKLKFQFSPVDVRIGAYINAIASAFIYCS